MGVEPEDLTLMEEAHELDTLEGSGFTFMKYDEAPDILQKSKMHLGRPIGMPSLDKMMDGVCSGELVIVTAPTGVGKSTFLQSVTWNLAKENKPSLWYTLEVSLPNFIAPFIKNDPGATWGSDGSLLKVSSQPIYFPKDVEKLDFATLKKCIRYAYLKYGVEHVFIDHLHYLLDSASLGKTNNISLFIGDRLRQLRQIAHETGVSIFLVCHLTKTEDGQRPTINNMRDSSFVGQEADAVIVLWRDRLKDPVSIDGMLQTHSPFVHVGLEKSRRTGNKGTFDLLWSKGLFYEPTQQQCDQAKFVFGLPGNIAGYRQPGGGSGEIGAGIL